MNTVFEKLTDEDQAVLMKLVEYSRIFHNGMERILKSNDPNEINKIIKDLRVERPSRKRSSYKPSDLNVLVKRLTTDSGTLEIRLCEYCGQPFFAHTTASKVYCERIVTDGKPCRVIGPTKTKSVQHDEFSKLQYMMDESLKFYQDLVKSSGMGFDDEYNEYKESLESALKAYKISPTNELKEKFMRTLLKK